MNEIKCPHCGKVFQVDKTGYAEIVKQVRDHEFERDFKDILVYVSLTISGIKTRNGISQVKEPSISTILNDFPLKYNPII